MPGGAATCLNKQDSKAKCLMYYTRCKHLTSTRPCFVRKGLIRNVVLCALQLNTLRGMFRVSDICLTKALLPDRELDTAAHIMTPDRELDTKDEYNA